MKRKKLQKYLFEIQNLQQQNNTMREQGNNEIHGLQQMIVQLQTSKEK